MMLPSPRSTQKDSVEQRAYQHIRQQTTNSQFAVHRLL